MNTHRVAQELVAVAREIQATPAGDEYKKVKRSLDKVVKGIMDHLALHEKEQSRDPNNWMYPDDLRIHVEILQKALDGMKRRFHL